MLKSSEYDVVIIIISLICLMKKLKLREFKDVPKFAQLGDERARNPWQVSTPKPWAPFNL